MSGAFVICNQLGHYWSKPGDWILGDRSAQVAFWEHRDEAVNMLFELSSKDTALRGDVVLCGITNNKPTDLEISAHPTPVAAAQSPEETLESEANDPTYE